jgi:hypothetical protein
VRGSFLGEIMNKKITLKVILIPFIAGAVGFYAGYKIAKHHEKHECKERKNKEARREDRKVSKKNGYSNE